MFLLNFALFNVLFVTGNVARHAVPGDISKKMCQKYTEYMPDRISECPFSNNKTGHISFASRQEFPHSVMFGYKNEANPEWLCGGSLISEQFVLTVAYCLANSKYIGVPVVARIGVTNLNETDHLQDIKIKEIIIHPQFKPPSRYNDIGLVKLEKKVDINNYARPDCLFSGTEIGVEKAINTGWGRIDFADVFEKNLQKVTLDIYTEKKCNDSYQPSSKYNLVKGITYSTMVCAGSKSTRLYQAIPGGSLLIQHQKTDGDTNKFRCLIDIVGLVSFGIGGVTIDMPDVYTRVSAFIPWIEEIVWK